MGWVVVPAAGVAKTGAAGRGGRRPARVVSGTVGTVGIVPPPKVGGVITGATGAGTTAVPGPFASMEPISADWFGEAPLPVKLTPPSDLTSPMTEPPLPRVP